MTAFHGVAVALLLIGLGALSRGVRYVYRGLRFADDPASSLWLARGLRGVVVAIGTLTLAAAAFFWSRGLLAFGLVFLAEELYETGVLLFILRRADRPRAHAHRPQAHTHRSQAHTRQPRVRAHEPGVQASYESF